MITREQALQIGWGETIYAIGCANADGTPQRWRKNGKVKTWKTRPNDFSMPIKRGLREYYYLDNSTMDLFTLDENEAIKGEYSPV
jgi:hypothetical protein